MALINLDGRHLLVTGAASGIGLAIARLAASLGAKLTLIDLDGVGLAAAVHALGESCVQARTGSVTDVAFVEQAVTEAEQTFGLIDSLVNCAGLLRLARAELMTAEQWSAVIDVHLTGSFNFLRAVGKRMIAEVEAGYVGDLAIVNISSDAGRTGSMAQVNYGAAKAGLFGLTMSAAREWGRYGIRVNTVSFGLVNTPMTDIANKPHVVERYVGASALGRWAEPDEAAKPVAFLLSSAASYVTGQHLSVNGGSFMSA